jgi:hypothetical protein
VEDNNMRVIGLFHLALANLAKIGACLAALMLACPAGAQSPQDGSGARTGYGDLTSVQVYAVGGGFIPFGTNGNVTGVDQTFAPDSALIANQSGGSSAVTPLFGARVHVPLLWKMYDEQRLALSVFFETGIQSGFAQQSFTQPFQNVSAVAGDFGNSIVQEYYQFPFLLGLTVPIVERSAGPGVLLDFYGGITLDSWAQVLQGGEANVPGPPGFYGKNRRLDFEPTVGLGLRMPVGEVADLPVIFGVSAEVQFRPGSVVAATSPNFPVTYYGTVDPHANLAIMARIGIAFGGR